MRLVAETVSMVKPKQRIGENINYSLIWGKRTTYIHIIRQARPCLLVIYNILQDLFQFQSKRATVNTVEKYILVRSRNQDTWIYPPRYILVDQDLSTQIYPSRLGFIHVDISQSTRIYQHRYILVYQAIQVDLSQSTRIYLRGYILVDQDISTWINPSLLGYIQVDKSQSTRIYLGG